MLSDHIVFWMKHFERPVWRDQFLEQFNISPERPRSRSKERWSKRSKRRNKK